MLTFPEKGQNPRTADALARMQYKVGRFQTRAGPQLRAVHLETRLPVSRPAHPNEYTPTVRRFQVEERQMAVAGWKIAAQLSAPAPEIVRGKLNRVRCHIVRHASSA